MIRILLLFIVLALFLEAKTISRTQVIMATFITISTDEKDKKHIENAFQIVKDVDSSLSSYKKDSIIYKLNENLFYIGLDNYSYEALRLSQKYYEKTDGYFDISIGSITKKLYKFGEEESIPTDKELDSALVKLKGMHLQRDKVCMEYGMQVDLGGMGKGYAVDKAAEYFRKSRVKNATVAASGDIRCLSTCILDVEDPFSDKPLASFETSIEDLGITTSGNYNRYVLSTKNNHLINPKLKKSQTKFISITLVGSLASADLDAYATASSVMPMEKAYRFLETLGVGYIVLQSDMKLVVSKNITEYVKNLVIDDTGKKKPRYIKYKR